MPLYRLRDKHRLEPFEQKDFGKENYESLLEDWLLANPEVLTDDPVLYIQRERPITREQDLLGIDQDGNVIIVELKRGRTHRDVIAQILDYAAEVESFTYEGISKIAQTYFEETEASHRNLIDAFRETFAPVLGGGVDARIEELSQRINQRQRLFIVAQEIDGRVEAVARYLRKNGMDVSCVQFSYHQTADGETVVSVETTVGREPIAPGGNEGRTSQPKYPPELREFLIAVRELVRETLPEELRNFEATKSPNVLLALWYTPPGWEAGYYVQFGDDEFQNRVTERLALLIHTLKPIVDEVCGSD